MSCQDIISVIEAATAVIIALCTIATIIYTVKTNNNTARETRKTAELNNKMAELKYRQLIIDANNTFITLSQNISGSSVPARDSAIEQLLNAYEVICYLKREEILTEEFMTLYGNEMLQVINSSQFKQKIAKSDTDFKYIKNAKNLLENKNNGMNGS